MFATIGCWLALSAHGSEVRVVLAGQFETQGHGALDVGYRRGPLSIQWFTETLDLRLTQADDRGRATFGVRAAAYAAGLWLSPWSGGEPDLLRAQRASYFGPDAEVQRYLGGGSWVGLSGFFRPHRFRPIGEATLRLRDTWWGRADVSAGVWREQGDIRATTGIDTTLPGRLSSHLFLDARWRPDGPIVPVAEAHAGLAQGTDDLTATRIGGLSGTNIGFAGAAWAEFWVEDYAVGRLGGRANPGPFELTAAVDLAAFTPPSVTTAEVVPSSTAVGLLGSATWRDRAMFATVAVGYSPTLPRGEGVWPVPIWVAIGSRWVRI